MKACAVVVTYGRHELGELLACVARQDHQLPTLVYVDDSPGLVIDVAAIPKRTGGLERIEVVYGPPRPSLGAVRHDAIEAARLLFDLDSDSGVLVLDDDDFYSSQHFAVTIRALREAKQGWTGGLAIGLTIDGAPVEYVCNDGGCGQHATWGFRLGRYDEVGGYLDVQRDEDIALAYALGFKTCTPHWHCTHVRRQTTHLSVSGLGFDRVKLRRQVLQLKSIAPDWSASCYFLERWCRVHFDPAEPTRPLRP